MERIGVGSTGTFSFFRKEIVPWRHDGRAAGYRTSAAEPSRPADRDKTGSVSLTRMVSLSDANWRAISEIAAWCGLSGPP